MAPQPDSRRAPGPFSGGGHTLGSDEVDSTFVPDPNTVDEEDEDDIAVRHLHLWSDGFSIEDGPLMRYDEPGNQELLRSIQQGTAPLSLMNVRQGQRVNLNVITKLSEAYVPPKRGNFSGAGHRLGAPAPSVGPGQASSMPGSFPIGSTSGAASTASVERPSINTHFEVDQTQATTSVQIRLADGTRMPCRMNLTHTVGDIRAFINASRPENLTRPYTIGTTFPNRTLEDNTQTIQAAGLVNSVIVQRWV
ncbi:SEP-domain-containing protein [Rhizopogon vinicolor AM-OR11-026]|uniref:SEP-domain-containing protein n=1 Tax=Rhizopogon vinicolor AM-OR11-026 TaxID=1314800 RepID=A0A1B7MYS1_9AGAM|nr:SEP-domain-containing protein [Rhizopogon vinicolor AM-OR11-026]